MVVWDHLREQERQQTSAATVQDDFGEESKVKDDFSLLVQHIEARTDEGETYASASDSADGLRRTHEWLNTGRGKAVLRFWNDVAKRPPTEQPKQKKQRLDKDEDKRAPAAERTKLKPKKKRFGGDCHTCGRTGHKASECRSGAKAKVKQQPAATPSADKKAAPATPGPPLTVKCYACGEMGHYSSDCKKKKKVQFKQDAQPGKRKKEMRLTELPTGPVIETRALPARAGGVRLRLRGLACGLVACQAGPCALRRSCEPAGHCQGFSRACVSGWQEPAAVDLPDRRGCHALLVRRGDG